jgi:hypothetical protein
LLADRSASDVLRPIQACKLAEFACTKTEFTNSRSIGMKLLVRSALLAGIAVLAIAGTALAGNHRNKVMTVNLPDGLTARVEYQGDVAPKVTVEARSPELAAAWSRSNSASSTVLDRISAVMDRQFDAMIHRVRMLDAAAKARKAIAVMTERC